MFSRAKSFLTILSCLILTGFAAIGSAAGAPGSENNTLTISSLGQQAVGIVSRPVTATDLPNQVTVPGKIEIIPTMQFDQHAPLSGRIAKVEVEAGQRIKKGEILAVVESTEMNQLAAQFLQSRLDVTSEFASQRAKLDTEVRQAEENLHLCDENLKRLKRLFEDKIAAQKDVLQAETDYQLAISRLQMARENRDIMMKTLKARINLIQEPIRQRLEIIGVDDQHINQMLDSQKTITTVPIVAARGGVITNIASSPGMSIDPSTNLFTIADLSTVWATAHVYESDMTRMHLGEKVDVKVHALSGDPVRGELTFIGSQVDPVTRTLPVRCELKNGDGRLKPDMYAELIIQTSESKPVVAVPKDALVSAMPTGSAVFLKQGDVYREVNVKTGRTMGDQVEIASGLNPGDVVVVRGAFQLHAQLVKDHGGEDLFVQPTEGEHLEDHAVDNKTGSMNLNMQTVLLIIAAAFLLGFAISALLLFKGQARHECEGELDDHHDHDAAATSAPTAVPAIPVESSSQAVAGQKKKTPEG